MDSFVNEKDFELLERDRCSFSVLHGVIKGDCDLIRSDHESVIFCHTAARYPVWLWTPDGAREEILHRAWRLAEEYRPLSAGWTYILKEQTAEYFIAAARETGLEAEVFERMIAYDCPVSIKPAHPADGAMHICTESDADEAAALKLVFDASVGEPPMSFDEARESVLRRIKDRHFFFWKNAAGKTVACCAFSADGELARVNHVLTLSEERRRHYAQSLVCTVTELVREQGFRPALNADADYPASNACYRSIGYVPRGVVCKLAAKK